MIVHNRQFGLGTVVVEAVNSRLAYSGKIVRGSAVAAVPKDLVGIQRFAVVVAVAAGGPAAGYKLGMPVIRMDCKNLKHMTAVLELLHRIPAVEEPGLVHLEHQMDS